MTLAHLKDKPTQTSSVSSGNSSSTGRFTAAARLLGTGNGSRGLGFGGGNGFTGRLSGSNKSPTSANASGVGLSNGPVTSSYDGEGTYLIFNVGDSIFISDYYSPEKASKLCISCYWRERSDFATFVCKIEGSCMVLSDCKVLIYSDKLNRKFCYLTKLFTMSLKISCIIYHRLRRSM